MYASQGQAMKNGHAYSNGELARIEPVRNFVFEA